jgi:hypothetical protein
MSSFVNTPLGITDPSISDAILQVAALARLPDAIVDNALRHLPRPHPAAVALDARPLLLIVRALLGAAADGAGIVPEGGATVVAIGPLPLCTPGAHPDARELRVDFLTTGKGFDHAVEIGRTIATAYPRVITVALSRCDTMVGLTNESGSVPRSMTGLLAQAALEDDEDGRALTRLWFLPDGSDVFTVAINATSAATSGPVAEA